MPTGATPIPKGLPGEQVRDRLLDVVEQRWSTPVTLVVAGAGFGKSTLLHQAIRANLADPQGVDVYLRCRGEHRDPALLARAVIEELSGATSGPMATDHVLAALRRLAPVDVALVLDDVHLLAGSPSLHLIDGLIDDLPAHVHLVLVGRELPALGLARLRAADEVIELTEDELAFTPAECQRLVEHFGRPADTIAGLGGWPALVRLALAARRTTAGQYLHEEVIAGLALGDRRALAALCLVRPAGSETLAEIVGRPVEVEGLADRLPLVTIDDRGSCEAHAMWDDYVETMLAPDALEILRQRAIEALAREGRLQEAGDLARRGGDGEALDRIATELVIATLSVPAIATARAWLAVWPKGGESGPGRHLLAAAVSVAEEQTEEADRHVDAALAAMTDETPPRVVFAAITLSIMGAFHRRDLARLSRLSEVAGRIDQSGTDPLVSLSVAMIEACRAAVDGDPVAAVRHLRTAPLEEVEPATARAAYRFLCVNLTLSGHADQAVGVAEGRLRRLGHPDNDWALWSAQWQAGNIDQYLRFRGADLPHPSSAPTRALAEAVVAQKLRAIAQACCGDPIDPDMALRPIVGRAASRAAGYQTVAAAALAVQQHHEETARRELEQFLERWDEVTEAELTLRRFLALGYVLVPRLRTRWDETEFGPSLAPARELARALLRGRSGRAVSVAETAPERVLVSLPLPWSVELACYLIEARQPFGRKLLDWLVATLGSVVSDELRFLAAATQPVTASAQSLVAAIPTEPSTTTRVAVLGPLEVSVEGVRSLSAELRRVRVRELLTLLVLEPKLSRDRAAGSLWPDLDPGRAAKNLRVTLSYVRRVLEPDRRRGDVSFHLLSDGSELQLRRSHLLEADYWEFVALLDEADLAQSVGDPHRAATALEAAISLWRGEPCPALTSAGIALEVVERIKLRYQAALLSAGEIRLTQGNGRSAASSAAAALVESPFDQAAHRLALAAAIQLRNPDLVHASLQRLDDALAELAMDPEPTTAMLRRQAARSILAA